MVMENLGMSTDQLDPNDVDISTCVEDEKFEPKIYTIWSKTGQRTIYQTYCELKLR